MSRALQVLCFAAAVVAQVAAERIVRLRSTVAPRASAGQVNTVPDVARPLPLTAVRLTGGPLKRAQELDAKYLLELEPDRMLAFYRQRAGLVPKAQPYGGWDGDGRNLTGHIAGHYLSAVSLMWAATGDVRFKERADYIVSELKAVQDKHGDGYLSALAGGRQAFGDLSKGIIKSAAFDLNGQWSPWYTLHKTFGGLRDAYRYADNRTALDVEVKFAAWVEGVLSPLSDAQLQQMLNTEFGGMNEVLADLYADTGDRRWLALSHKFDHRAVLDPLVHGEDRLNGLHGNTQVPKILGSAVRYAYTGDRDDRSAATFFWDRVVGHHTFATGGHGKDEYFREPDQLGRIIDGRTAETCNVYNMLKLTRRLFALEPDVRYAEFHERALFNHILGSMDPADGTTCYMVPVGRAVRREYQDLSRSFTCCVGSGMESHALHGLGIYYESGDRFWVNLYAPSTARWQAAGVSLDMATTFPEGESASLTLTAAAPKPFTLALRRPSWAADGFAVRVNGVAVPNLPKPGSYVELKRTWKTGDRVQLTLPKALRLDLTPDNKRRAAILWGPLVLAGDLGPEPPHADRGLNADGSALVEAPRPITTPMLVAAERPIADWLRPVAGKPGTFRTAGVGKDQDLELSPFYRLHRRTYAAYWDLFTPPEYDAKLAELAAERERLRKLDAVTVAFLRPGDGQREKTFNQQGEETSIVRADDRAGRRGTKWFSYAMPIDSGAANVLVVTYQTDNRRIRTFDILVEGQRVASQTLEPNDESRFFDVEYALPAALVAGKPKVTVRFEATNGNEIGAVFGVRTIRANGQR
jgi:uncharacterized protein